MVNNQYGIEDKRTVNGILSFLYIGENYYKKENYVTNDFFIYVNRIESNASAKENYAA